MTNSAQWGVLVGSILPPVAAWLQKQKWPPTLNAAVFLAACLIAATATSYVDQKTLTGDEWIQTVIWVVGSGLASYHAIWKPTGIIDAARKLTPK